VRAKSARCIVFCHGLWADGSCFSKVIAPLQAERHQVIAAQYGLDTPEGDVATVIRTLGRVDSPAILVGHSYGGSVITAAGTDDRVAGLVYITALAPDADETSQSLLDQFPTTDICANTVRKVVLASSAPQGASGMHGWAPEVIDAVGKPETSAAGYLAVFFTDSEASRAAGQQALLLSAGRSHSTGASEDLPGRGTRLPLPTPRRVRRRRRRLPGELMSAISRKNSPSMPDGTRARP
jgi:pimeloyl-ACP methyl ester carboxylesterase